MALLFVLAVLPCCVASAEVSALRQTPIVRAVNTARPSVVNIQGQKTVSDATKAGATRQVNGMGTGVVIDPRGYVLTNHHVVDGVRQIRVTLDDGAVDIARLVAHDRATDLAVIKVDVGRKLDTITIGTSSDLMTGESVIAVGNAYGYEHTVTRGIISALHRDVQVSDTQAYDDLIQTDASINPGNSGGPLLNIEGKMIGVNVAVRAGAQGIGFAIPVDSALKVAANLMSIEQLENTWHGIKTTQDAMGRVTVRRVTTGSPADRSGLKQGDVLKSFGDVSIQRQLDIERALLGRRVGDQVNLQVTRAGEPLRLDFSVARLGAPTRVASTPKPRSIRNSVDEKSWELLGVVLDEEPRETFSRSHTNYRGGMRVVDVRRDGPAAKRGIRRGDILVGMHRWETATDEDLRYIVNAKTLTELPAVKFYILRGNETLHGEMRVASTGTTRR